MAEIDLSQRFPGLEPVAKPPSLTTVNGCGMCVYGRGDLDPETGTYLKHYCFSFIYLPIFWIRTYRVADAQYGWYFLGRQPLPASLKAWNMVMLLLLATLGAWLGWHQYTGTPSYQAAQRIAEARTLSSQGQVGRAAQMLRDVAVGRTDRAAEAMGELRQVLDTMQQAPAAQAAQAVAVAAQLQTRPGQSPIVPDLFERSLSLASAHTSQDPQGALAIVNALEPIRPGDARLTAAREPILTAIIAKDPSNLDALAALASIYDQRREHDNAEALLAPHADKLGTTEAARILGQIRAAQGRFEEAYAMLQPYTDAHLPQLHQAEQALKQAYDAAWSREIGLLEKNSGPDSFYKKYEQADSDEAKAVVVNDYVQGRINGDASIHAASQSLRRHAQVVPVVLDLGIVMLRRAESMTDATQRREQLEAAEKTFLAIRDIAGDSDDYKLYLAQVYYWLGKHDQGRTLFDDMLASSQRSYDMLMQVGRTLRDVGAMSEARAMLEEAFKVALNPQKAHVAAHLRAITSIDLDDRIQWLDRSGGDLPEVRATLASARGRRALEQNRDDEAIGHLRDSINVYKSMPESASTFNNAALVYFDLFFLTGDRDDHAQGVAMMERALALQPGDSILLGNCASALTRAAVLDLIADQVDVAKVRAALGLGLLRFLYHDEAGLAEWRHRVETHPLIVKALARYEQAMVLAPKGVDNCQAATSIYGFTRNLTALETLFQRVQTASFDFADSEQVTRDYLAGSQDEKYRRQSDDALARSRRCFDSVKGGPRDINFAIASCALVDALLTAANVDIAIDEQEMLRLAQEAHAAAPSAETHSTLQAAYLYQAHTQLAAADTQYAALARPCRRSLSRAITVAAALQHSDALRQAVLAQPAFAMAVELTIAHMDAFPSGRSAQDWLFIDAARPELLAPIVESLQQDRCGQLRYRLDCLLSPMSAADAIQLAWLEQALGHPSDAQAIIQSCAARGVPMPIITPSAP